MLEFKKKDCTPSFRRRVYQQSVTTEYGVSKASISEWCREFSKEFQTEPQAKEEYDSMREKLRLKRENEKTVEGNRILKTTAFFVKEIG